MKTNAWFRAHPEAVFRNLSVFIDPTSEDIEKKPYFLAPEIADDMFGSEGVIAMTGYLICTSGGKVMLFLVREADFDGSMHHATEAKHEACVAARGRWTRLSWSKELMAYEISFAEGDGFAAREPRWPEDLSEETILRLVFGKQVIDCLSHPVLRRFRGEAL